MPAAAATRGAPARCAIKVPTCESPLPPVLGDCNIVMGKVYGVQVLAVASLPLVGKHHARPPRVGGSVQGWLSG